MQTLLFLIETVHISCLMLCRYIRKDTKLCAVVVETVV